MASYAILVQLMLLFTTFLLATTKPAMAAIQPDPDCPTSCGNLTNIPFPFGLNPNCYLDQTFLITCNTRLGRPIPYLGPTNTEVLNISLDGEMRVATVVARNCNNRSIANSLELSRFSFSNTRNRFTVVGCNTMADLSCYGAQFYTTQCESLCPLGINSVENGTCWGRGCCEALIPPGVTGFQFTLGRLENYSLVVDFNPCSYAFVAEIESYNFSSLDLMDLQGRQTLPVVVDWAVGDLSCQQSVNNASSYACRALESECVDARNGPGYRCNCLSGFEGNPYLVDGCQDINECEISSPCHDGSICTNLRGSYTCTCQEGYEDEGLGCRRRQANSHTVLIISLSISISLLLLLVGCSWIYWRSHNRKIKKQREKFFHLNGGIILKQQLSEQQDSAQTTRIFSTEDLNRATNNYDDNRVIGQGGYGTVYKGLLPDGREIAIKKSKISDQSQIEQFINEVVILSQVNHKNVVKLIGCCLETEVPLLVYEFISNGNLSYHIHDKSQGPHLSWEMRLKVAVETAGALAYLHSAISTPIIHRDIKSTNILLDDKYTTKVSDFGASRLVPVNKTQLTTLVQGTFGYLDPEYFHSSQLTKKSDVYSFGVLLAELLTGQPALSFNRSEEERNLAMYFMLSMKKDRFLEILDDRLMNEQKTEEMKEVAMLAHKCLRMKGEDRPTMKEVAIELEGLRKINNHPWLDIACNSEVSEHLVRDSSLH